MSIIGERPAPSRVCPFRIYQGFLFTTGFGGNQEKSESAERKGALPGLRRAGVYGCPAVQETLTAKGMDFIVGIGGP